MSLIRDIRASAGPNTPHFANAEPMLHRSMRHGFVPLVGLSLLAGGCASLHESSGVAPVAQSSASSGQHPSEGRAPRAGDATGYALLFDLLGDEKNVSKLLIIKRERAELRGLIRDIAQRCGQAHKELEGFAKADRALNLKTNGLPGVEIQTRDAIGKTKAKHLLTESGKEFELRLLIAQQEALTYAGHLAAAISKTEANSQRAQFLRQLASDLSAFEQRVTSMLLANYRLPAAR
jgi:hypothetical protein